MSKSITVERVDPLTPSINEHRTFWRVSGPRVRGVVTALLGYPDGRDKGPQLYVGLSWSATDANGRTEYRNADPDKFEVQTMSAVDVDPLRVNGVPYSGTVYFSVPDGQLKYGGYTYNVTDAGWKIVREVGRQIAAELGTPENIHAAKVRDLAREEESARADLDKATAAHNAALSALERARAEQP